MEMINGFSELAMRALGEGGNEYYVYALIDPRNDKVFYIGKGTKNRVFSHEKESDKAQDVETRKVEIIKEIESENLNVKRVILHYGLTEREAFVAEAALINLLKFTSSITLSNIVAGHGVHEALTVENFEREKGAKKLKVEDIKHNILVIKINNQYRRDMSAKELYDKTRGIWVASLTRVRNDVEYVFAVYNQLIVAVYKPDAWYRVRDNEVDAPIKTINEGAKHRVYFVSKNYEILDENQKAYLYKTIAGFEKNQSAQNPITYLMATIEKQNKINLVRRALDLLGRENKIIYKPKNMPKSDDWIKFQTLELNKLFEFSGLTKWDGEKFASISYLEYHLASNTIMITYKTESHPLDKTDVLEQHKEELDLLDDKAGKYWHLKKYKIDYKTVCESEDKVDAMKKQIESCLIQIKEDLNNIDAKIG